MMGSSKYEFEPENFEKDIQDKLNQNKLFKESVQGAIYRDYKYRDGKSMSYKAKREILIKIYLEFIGGKVNG